MYRKVVMFKSKSFKMKRGSSMEDYEFLSWRKIKQLIKKTVDAFLKKHDLKMIDVILMNGLYIHPDADTLNDLSDALCVNKGQASRSMDSLVKRGYVTSEVDIADRRLIHFALTEKGQQLTKELDDVRQKGIQKIMVGIPEDKIQIFIDVLHQINQNIKRIRTEGE